MLGILVRRLASAVPIMLMVSLITFTMIHMIPGDPAAAIAGLAATQDQIANIRADLGLDQPVLTQLLRWYGNLLQGDLGRSLLLGQPVLEATMERLPVTLALSAYALVLTLVIGLGSGIIAALRQNTWVDQAAMLFAMIGISLPNFYLGLLMIILFAVELRWLPTGGYVPLLQDPLGWLATSTMPAISLALLLAGLLARITRSTMLEVLRQDYIRTAAAGRHQACPVERADPHHHRHRDHRQPADLRFRGDRDLVLHPRHRAIADPGGAQPRLSDGAGRAADHDRAARPGQHRGRCLLRGSGSQGTV